MIYISTTSPSGAQSLDPVALAKKPGFTAMLAADLAIIGDN